MGAVPTVTLGVDLGGTKIQVVAVANRRVVGEARHATPRTDAKAVIAEIVSATREASSSAGASIADVRAIGIGTPGTVDTATGHVSASSNVPGFMEDVALGPAVSEAFSGVPVTVDNDVRVATMGEFRRGAGRPYRNLLGVFVGTGVGGGLILEGRLRRGRAAPARSGTPSSSPAPVNAPAATAVASRPTLVD